MNSVLVIEDDQALARGLAEILREQCYEVVCAPTGERGLSIASGNSMDLIILDLMLPDWNGMDVCGELRRRRVSAPILILTSKSDETDKVLGLETGADDYVTKPFSTRELLARVRALIRRRGRPASAPEELHCGELHVDFKRREIIRGSLPVHPTPTEFEVLRYLVARRGEVVTRDELLNHVWGYERFPTTRTVDTCIAGLRKKIEPDPPTPCLILTVHGVGYRFPR